MSLQPLADIDRHYDKPDPWGYENNPQDMRRKSEILGVLPERAYGRVLDIGCGDGFLTFDLPGAAVVGVDVSPAAVGWADKRKATLSATEAARFTFRAGSVFELPQVVEGEFDLVVITGVLYPQYIGAASSVVLPSIDGILRPGGVLVSCHIDSWNPPRFPYALADLSLYPYRDYMHRLEVYLK